MIALGSCTMKLNAAADVTFKYALLEYTPFAPLDQVAGYTKMLKS
jgi:glycine cleavage system protein P-like pyridoxal-binding family